MTDVRRALRTKMVTSRIKPLKDEVALSVRLRPETWNRSAQFTELVRSDQSLKTQHDFV